MKRVVYTSVAVRPMGCLSNIDILRTSREYNEDQEITGFLVRSRRIFAQVLEGPDAAVDQLVAAIRRDPRHSSVCTWENGPIDGRLFPEWSMALAFSDDEEMFGDLCTPGTLRPKPSWLKDQLREAANSYARGEDRLDL